MPDFGAGYSPDYPYPIDYSYYGSNDAGTLYFPGIGQTLDASGYIDPVFIPEAPPIIQDVFVPIVPVTVQPSPVDVGGPADIFSTLPPLFNLTDPNPPATTTETTFDGGNAAALSGINITVNNAVRTVNNIGDQVGAIIARGIEDGADVAAQTAKDSATAVTNAVGGLANNILSAVQSGISQIWDWLKQAASFIASNAGQIIQFLGTHLADIGHAIANDLVPIITSVAGVVDKVATEIQSINDTLIQPIANTIVGAMNTITTLTKALEGDLHDGLKGLLQIPTDVAGAMTTLDATMQRTIEQLGANNRENVDVVLDMGFHKEIGTHLDTLNGLLNGTTKGVFQSTTFSDKVTLPEPDAKAIAGETMTAAWDGIKSFVSEFMHGGKSTIDDISKGLPGFGLATVDLIQLPLTLAVVVLTTLAELKPILEWMEEDAAGKAGLAKLQPGDALTAFVRGFISNENLSEELKVQGWDAQRIQVMRDLQVSLIDISTAVDMFYRGIITRDDLAANMSAHGFTDSDTGALITQAGKVFGVDTATRLWRYGQIDDDALRAVLTINRYSEDEAQAFIDTALRPEQTADYINRTQRDSVFSSHLVIDPFYEAPPQPYIDAAKAEGVNAQVARDAWRSSFQFPQLNQWLSLYFRGIRTHTELMAAMDYYRVPQNLRDDYIQANRALIPFRTIPGMVAAGIIDESYAKQQLQGHGYDLQAAEALLAYSKTKVQTTTPVVAQQIHEISVATAKEFWNEGAFTDDQLKQLLVAHGYSDYTAAVTLTTMQIAHAQKLRKQVGQDIVNEALAGILTDDQAIQQFSQRNFSIQEIAKLTRQLRTGRRQNAKIPSEAELLKMAKQSIITPNDYGNALSAMGYAANWVQAIVQLNFPDGFPEPTSA
jgi:hypothetical protein